MRYFETVRGTIVSDSQIEDAILITTGSEETIDDPTIMAGIKREVLPQEWRYVAKNMNKVGAIRLFRDLTDCSLVEAREAVEDYINNPDDIY